MNWLLVWFFLLGALGIAGLWVFFRIVQLSRLTFYLSSVCFLLLSTFLYINLGAYTALAKTIQLAKFEAQLSKSTVSLTQLQEQYQENTFILEKIAELWVSVQNYPEAINLYQRLLAENPNELEFQLALAQTKFMANQGHLDQEGRSLVAIILKQYPQNPLARNLHAMDQFQQGNYAAALSLWQQLYQEAQTPHSKAALAEVITKAKALQQTPSSS